jgi:hypothetical protein
MKVIDAFWEKRNLGVDCKEIIIDNTDTVNDLAQIEELIHTTQYIVAKVPTGCFEVNQYLSKLGFSFIECSINLILDVQNARLGKIEERLNKSINYHEVTKEGLGKIYNELSKGNFDSDRISMDSFFTLNQASNRYINWIKDEVAKEAKVYEMILGEDKSIGFFAFKPESDYSFLSGLFKDYLTSGLGFSVIRKPIEETISRGGKVFHSYVSSNNPSIINVHLNQGFKLNQISNVFIRHL